MKRTNTFNIEWDDPDGIKDLAIGCSTMWNKLNYKRRKQFFHGEEIDFNDDEFYNKFKEWIGSATSQQIRNKNNSSWKSFFVLLKKYKKDKIEEKPSPPGYWKDRDKDKKELRILIRNDCYKIDGRKIKLPFGKTGKIKGNPHWEGDNGRLEIYYDRIDKCWRAYQSMEVKPRHQPSGHEKAYVDLGIIYPITAKISSIEKPIAYNGGPILSDWWSTTKLIDKYKSILKEQNNKDTSKRLRKLYTKRKRRFRDTINKIVHDFAEKCFKNDVDEVITGDLTGIRENIDHGKKGNSMIHNYWSNDFLVDRLRTTLENFGIELTLIDESGTSSKCPRCGSKDNTKRGRLFKCNECGLEAHRDVVGAYNISFVHRNDEGNINRMMAHPEVIF